MWGEIYVDITESVLYFDLFSCTKEQRRHPEQKKTDKLAI